MRPGRSTDREGTGIGFAKPGAGAGAVLSDQYAGGAAERLRSVLLIILLACSS